MDKQKNGVKITPECQEVYLSIVGYGIYDNYYMVSNLGNIKRLNGTPLKVQIRKQTNRCFVCLSVNQLRHTFSVHRIVAKAFIPNHENKQQVNHINGNPLDNQVENLEWNTARENMQHAFGTGLQNNNGRKTSLSKLNFHIANKIRKAYQDNKYNQYELAKQYNVSQSEISRIINNKKYKI